ncbi:MAG TPA: class I adenylate-forming enzyme family protein [Acidimicrobiales bacterium]|nr:class I adenylate-forming enzyme family protein [Acidimicrobiales bacterium]
MSGGGPPPLEVLEPGPAEEAQRRVAGALERAGLGPGDRVAFCVGSSAALLCGVLGALRRGIVPVLLNTTLLRAERDTLLEDAQPALTVLDHGALAALADGPPADLAPFPLARPMHYTSGTTGRPKGVWSGVLDEDGARALFDDEADLWGFGPGDTHLMCTPMYHSVSVRLAAAALLRGGRVLVLDHFDADATASALVHMRPTTTFMAPTVLGRLLRSAASPPVLDSLRLLVHAGSPCPAALKRQAMARVRPGVLWEFYGATEGQFTVCGPDEWAERPGTVGRARPGRRLEVDGQGVIWCDAPPFARFDYWLDPGSTARAWRGDAFTVGDLGRVDADGYLFIDGRRDDLVISGGVNVYPAEVEAVLSEAPGVEEVAVFGVDDDAWGQRVCAAVVGEAREEDLRRHAEARLAPYKRPKSYVLVSELPRTATGKILRRALASSLGPACPDPQGRG